MSSQLDAGRTGSGLSLRYYATGALGPGFHGARTQWIRDFMAFQLARRT